MKKIGIGLYGANGHQLSPGDIEGENASIVGVCDAPSGTDYGRVAVYGTLEEMLRDGGIDLVSICADPRADQGKAILLALNAGKHVYAEKPCVMEIGQLDFILDLAAHKKLIFCEMAGTAYEQPYHKVKELVESGALGEIVQIFAQKSYPYADWRPQDEATDGGLILQNAVYGIRFVEHIAGQKIASVHAIETSYGNPKGGGLRMAASLNITLESGGIATVIANYLNQPGTKIWGNEELRIFGTTGYLKTNPSDGTVELYSKDGSAVYQPEPCRNLFGILLDCLDGNKPLPISAYDLTHPTRVAIQAKKVLC